MKTIVACAIVFFVFAKNAVASNEFPSLCSEHDMENCTIVDSVTLHSKRRLDVKSNDIVVIESQFNLYDVVCEDGRQFRCADVREQQVPGFDHHGAGRETQPTTPGRLELPGYDHHGAGRETRPATPGGLEPTLLHSEFLRYMRTRFPHLFSEDQQND